MSSNKFCVNVPSWALFNRSFSRLDILFPFFFSRPISPVEVFIIGEEKRQFWGLLFSLLFFLWAIEFHREGENETIFTMRDSARPTDVQSTLTMLCVRTSRNVRIYWIINSYFESPFMMVSRVASSTHCCCLSVTIDIYDPDRIYWLVID